MWRLIDSGRCSGEQTIALTKAIVNICESSRRGGVLRFFQLDGSYVSIGCHQDVEREIRIPYCQTRGIGLIRRVSGGGVSYLDKEAVGWQFIVSKNSLRNNGSQHFMFRAGHAITRGLGLLGLQAAYRSPGVIEVDGKLLLRLHIHETHSSLLCEGYVPMSVDVRETLRSLRVPTEKLSHKEEAAYKTRNTALNWLCGESIPVRCVRKTLTEAISKEFNIVFSNSEITSEELEYADIAKYSPKTPTILGEADCQLVARRRGSDGELTAKITLDMQSGKIIATSITGDFYIYPDKTIENLQQKLIGLTAPSEAIIKAVEACMSGSSLLGLSVEDFKAVIKDAINKQTFSIIGAKPHEFSDMYYVGGLGPSNIAANVKKHTAMPFLLPYCAKEPNCSLRYSEGCGCCGCCDVGEAYNLAARYGLRPITIQNYEMLEASLRNMKAMDLKMFLGTCCEEFINKHYNDFEAIGMPGVLVGIDSSTCYEIGHEADAHKGLYENQTQLKIDLLERIIKGVLMLK